MNNNFNLKQYLAENRLLGEIEIGKGNYQLQQLFDKVIEDVRKSFQEFPIEDPELSDHYEYTVQNAKYGTIEELAESLYETWVAINSYNDDSDYRDFIVYIIGVCKELNFKNAKDLVRALVNVNYSDPYNEEYFNEFEDELEGLNEIEIGMRKEEEPFSTPKDLADFLNQYKEKFFDEFDTDVIRYVIDAYGPFESNGEDVDQEWFEDNWDDDEIKNFIKEYWMKPEMEFKVVDLDGFLIVTISWPGDTDTDMSGYGWFRNTPLDDDPSLENNGVVNFSGRRFWYDYN
jgi:hypothetical protein